MKNKPMDLRSGPSSCGPKSLPRMPRRGLNGRGPWPGWADSESGVMTDEAAAFAVNTGWLVSRLRAC
jgi:hypothetical protein